MESSGVRVNKFGDGLEFYPTSEGGGGGTSGGIGYSATFDNDDLVDGVLTVTHNLGIRYNIVQVFDNNFEQILPDSITLDSTTECSIDLSSFAPISGTWYVVVAGGGGTSNHADLSNLNWAAANHTIDADILPTASGLIDIGSSDLPFASGYFKDVYVSGGIYGGGAEDLIARGFELDPTSTTEFSVYAGVLYHGTTRIALTSNASIDITVASNYIGGVSLQATTTWLYVYVQSNGTILLHTSPPDKADTSGNTDGTKYYYLNNGIYYRCIGAIYLNSTGSGEITDFHQHGNEIRYIGYINVSSSTGTLSNVDCSAAIPAISMKGIFVVNYQSYNNTIALVFARPHGDTSYNLKMTDGSVVGAGGLYIYQGACFECFTDSNQAIDLLINGNYGSATTDVCGYYLNIR